MIFINILIVFTHAIICKLQPLISIKKFNPYDSKLLLDDMFIKQKNFFLSFLLSLTGGLFSQRDGQGFAIEFGIIDYLFIIPAVFKFFFSIFVVYMPNGRLDTFWQKALFVVSFPLLVPAFILAALTIPFNHILAALTTLLLSPILILYRRYLLQQNALVLTTPVFFSKVNPTFPDVNASNKNTLDYNLLLTKLQDNSQWQSFVLQNFDKTDFYISPIYLTCQNNEDFDKDMIILGMYHLSPLSSPVKKCFGFIIPSRETKQHILAIQKLDAYHFSQANIDHQALNHMMKHAPLQKERQAWALFTVSQAFKDASCGTGLEIFTKGTVTNDLYPLIADMAGLGTIPKSTYQANECLSTKFKMKNLFFQDREASRVLTKTENSLSNHLTSVNR
ncbi:MAG: hypothetical protein H0U75_10930 [Legionella sp.]|nr:hypothetical protein [Legionella sp.]